MNIKDLGQRITRLRNLKGLTYEALAKASGVTENTLLAIEKGRGNPTIGTINAIEGVLGPLIQPPVEAAADQWALVFRAIAENGPVRVNASLYLLTRDEAYLQRLRELGLDQVVPALQKLHKVL